MLLVQGSTGVEPGLLSERLLQGAGHQDELLHADRPRDSVRSDGDQYGRKEQNEKEPLQ